MKPVVAITGAAGYVGSITARYFIAHGWKVRGFSRRHTFGPHADFEFHPFQLGEKLDASLLNGVSVLIHAAYDFELYNWKEIEKVNVQGSLKVFETAREAGVERIIFISSISSFENCRALYGKAKLEVEHRAKHLLSAIIRPGMVFGSEKGGTYGKMAQMAEKSAVLPIVGSGLQPLYLVHEDDLARLIFEVAISNKKFEEPITVANPRPVAFREVLRMMAAKKGRRPTLIPMPAFPIMAALKTAELVGLKPRLRADGVVNMMNPNLHVDFSPLLRLGFDPRPFTLENMG